MLVGPIARQIHRPTLDSRKSSQMMTLPPNRSLNGQPEYLQKSGKSSSIYGAGWSSLVARRAHNPKVVGSNPTPATSHHS